MNWLNKHQVLNMIKKQVGGVDRLGKKLMVKDCCEPIQKLKPNYLGELCSVINNSTPSFHPECWVCIAISHKPEFNLMQKVLFK